MPDTHNDPSEINIKLKSRYWCIIDPQHIFLDDEYFCSFAHRMVLWLPRDVFHYFDPYMNNAKEIQNHVWRTVIKIRSKAVMAQHAIILDSVMSH